MLPWQISATEFLCFEGKKFSKSRRIGIWVDEALELLEPDYWRFYLLLIRPEKRDTNFMWDEFTDVINNKLIASYGNFVYRVLSFTDRYFKGVIPKPGEFKEVDKNAVEKWRKTVKEIEGHLVKIEIKKAVEKLLKLTDVGNEYFQAKEPWKAVKEKVEGANTTIYICVNMCASLAIATVSYTHLTLPTN